MKLRFLALAAAGLAVVQRAGASRAAAVSNPVTRVVGILQNLQQKCEDDLEKEKTAFAKFKCWADTIIATKTASNEQGSSRKESLEQYVADITAGKIEFTTERVDLEKEIAALANDLERAEELRKQEHEDFLAAEAETEQAITALGDAIKVLEGETFLALAKKGRTKSPTSYVALARAVEVGRRFLSKGDALLLDRIVSGDVPEVDWKKLNRKATFKMSYKKRSGEIVETLKTLKMTFEGNLEEMKTKEATTVETYDKLMKSKKAQKDGSEEALSKMELEGAARGQTKSEAQAEIDDLKKQIDADVKFIDQTKLDLEIKQGEWNDRQKIRLDEIKAISEAMAVLQSETARDTMKSSYKSQGYTLLRRAASASADARLSKLAALVAEGPEHFKAVIEAIDGVLAVLEEEAKADLSTKESCEKSRMENTRNAVLKAREIDELSDTLSRLQSEIAEIDTQVGEKGEEIKKIEGELESAETLRKDEHNQWVQSDADDTAAKGLLEQAKTVLETFYKEHALLQKGARQPNYDNEFVSEAGAAPPPPPKTWEDPYAGHQAESQGIFTILTLLIEDIEADKVKAKAAEDEAASAYEKFKGDSTLQMETIQAAITELDTSKSNKVQEGEDATGSRSIAKDELGSTMKTIQDSQAGCDFQLINFATRKAKRAVEKDGLLEAKAVLMGATFE